MWPRNHNWLTIYCTCTSVLIKSIKFNFYIFLPYDNTLNKREQNRSHSCLSPGMSSRYCIFFLNNQIVYSIKHDVNLILSYDWKQAYLGSQIFWGTTECLHGGCICDPFFAKSKICNFYVAIFIQHQILQLHSKKNDMVCSIVFKFRKILFWKTECWVRYFGARTWLYLIDLSVLTNPVASWLTCKKKHVFINYFMMIKWLIFKPMEVRAIIV